MSEHFLVWKPLFGRNFIFDQININFSRWSNVSLRQLFYFDHDMRSKTGKFPKFFFDLKVLSSWNVRRTLRSKITRNSCQIQDSKFSPWNVWCPKSSLHRRVKCEMIARGKFLRRALEGTCFHKFHEWSSVGNRIAYGQLFRARSRYVIFANGSRETWLLAGSRSPFPSFRLPSWKTAAFCYRRIEQQPPSACFSLYRARCGGSCRLAIGRRKWPPKTDFHLLEK